ncbi:MAG TPA: hypothetical protein VKB50_18945 [Vicinamibacterales bacterium]|nr:hypothetical protein [Vicinamibacterales bacterium]
MRALIAAVALVLLSSPSFAQTAADPHWTPWLGCWNLVLENEREGSPIPQAARELPRSRGGTESTPRVCVEPAPEGGATFRTTIGTETAILQTLIADGVERPLTDADCRGTQRAEWSRNGLRLYVRAELTCKDDKAPRHVSGFAMLGPDATWTDVQAIATGDRNSYRVRRYRRAEPVPNTELPRGMPLTVDDVKEANGKVSPQALEAALVETNAWFPLSSRALIGLADAKVPDHVIDLMVALSYPKRFVVERTARADRPGPVFDDPFNLGGAFGYPIWSDSFGFYSSYGYSPYFYSPFAYGYSGVTPFFAGSGGFNVIDLDGVVHANRPSGNGRVVDGQGYTRVRPREPEPTATTVQGSSAPVASSAPSSSGSSSGSGSVTSQGFTSGGSSGGSSSGSSGGSSGGDGGGRTAQPR